jgi:hypothetical protein
MQADTMNGHMRAIAWLLRVFCYLFHTMISVALLALGVVGIASGVQHMKVEMLPWQGTELTHWLIGLGAAGLASVILTVMGKLRFLLLLWSIYVLGMLIKGVFLTPSVSFDGPSDFHNWLLLMGSAALSLIGSFTLLGRRRA